MTRVMLALIVFLAWEVPAAADGPNVPLFADRDLGDALVQAAGELGTAQKRVAVVASAAAAACATAPGATPRLALLARTPSRVEQDRCVQTASAEVNVVEIGRRAVALVVPMHSPVWAIDIGSVFRGLGRNADETTHPATWADVDPAYPRLPIGLLAPPSDSRSQRLFETLIMEPGCNKVATARTPFDRKSRAVFCSALRTDMAVVQRQGGARDVAAWAATAPAGQIAVVSVTELQQLDRQVVPLLLDGALPTAANIDSGRYPAAEHVALMIVLPRDATPAQRSGARDAAFNLLAEASIGPSGILAPAGLLPLSPPQRFAARSQAVAFLEQR